MVFQAYGRYLAESREVRGVRVTVCRGTLCGGCVGLKDAQRCCWYDVHPTVLHQMFVVREPFGSATQEEKAKRLPRYLRLLERATASSGVGGRAPMAATPNIATNGPPTILVAAH